VPFPGLGHIQDTFDVLEIDLPQIAFDGFDGQADYAAGYGGGQ